MAYWWGIVAALVLVMLNGFFVATEFSIVKVRRTRLRELEKRGSGAARRALSVVDRLDEYLSATQLGITLASLGLGWIGEPAFARVIEPAAARLGLGEAAVESIGLTLAFTLITFLHIVFGELAPKSLAIQRAEGTTLAVALPMRLFYGFFYPVIWTLNGVARAVLRLFGLHAASETELAHSEEELRLIVAGMRERAGPENGRLQVFERSLQLPSRRARQLMVSRADVVALRLDHTPEERRKLVRESGHARFPVIDGDIDHVVGIVDVRDLYLSAEPRGTDELRRILTLPLCVPELMTVETLLREFRRMGQKMAIVVDEYGGTAGLVTVGDVVSAVLGEGSTEERLLTPLPGGEFAVDPRMPIAEFAAELRVDLDPGDSVTVAGLVMEQLGRMPAPGDRVSVGGVELRVEKMDGPRIARLSARRRGAHPGSDNGGGRGSGAR
jgi:CBS domain containing-hemolysin-like protein